MVEILLVELEERRHVALEVGGAPSHCLARFQAGVLHGFVQVSLPEEFGV
jgi:hypothetical protein